MLVTALVSTYNSQKWLAGRLDNLLAQSLGENLEIIVIDSGSQENEGALVAEYQQRHSNIIYLRSPRESLYAAWNRGIERAQGAYLTSANCDDRLCLHALERMVDCLQREPQLALAYANQWQSEEEATVMGWSGIGYPTTPHQLVRRSAYRHHRLMLHCIIGPQPLWRRGLHDEFGLFDEEFQVAGDWEFWLRVAEKKPMRHLEEPLGLYFRNPQGLEHSQRELLLRENQRILSRYLSLRP